LTGNRLSTNLYLVGPMGVGKTTIGRHLAPILNKTFKDSDREIEQRTGASIPLIFELEGEAGFRKREQAIIAELTQEQNLILSTGGGAVLCPENRRLLKCNGWVIYLYASLNELMERTAHSRQRPLLQTADPRARLEQLLLERHPLYKEVANITIKTGDRTIRQVVRTILRRLRQLEFHENSTS